MACARVVLLSCVFTAAVYGADPNEFLDVSLRGNGGTVLLPGRLWVPEDGSGEPLPGRPLIVFLHGAGENGSDNRSQVNGNIDDVYAEARRRNAYLYAPQWGGANGWTDAPFAERVQQVLVDLRSRYSLDGSRIYVTGISAGGGRTQLLFTTNPEMYAAAAPVCAVAAWSADFAVAAGLPVWLFHARNDNTVGVGNSRFTFNELLEANGVAPLWQWPATADPDRSYEFGEPSGDAGLSPLRYTEYRSGDHFIWSRVYRTAALYEWMFSYARGPSCRADVNGDGFVDFFDYDAFVQAFEQGDLASDFNSDGFLDFFDYDEFVVAYEVGC